MIQPADLNPEPLPDRPQSLHFAQSECCVNATNDAILHRTFIHRQASLSRTTDRFSASRQRSSIVREVFLTGQVDVMSIFRIADNVSASMRPVSSRSNASSGHNRRNETRLGESGHNQFSTDLVSTAVDCGPVPLGKWIRDILATSTTETSALHSLQINPQEFASSPCLGLLSAREQQPHSHAMAICIRSSEELANPGLITNRVKTLRIYHHFLRMPKETARRFFVNLRAET